MTKEEKRKKSVAKVTRWRQKTKVKLVAYKGGKCKICSYDKCIANLVFHHLDPSKKDFPLTAQTKAYRTLQKEADKCVLLCCRCHGEVHAGMTSIPL